MEKTYLEANKEEIKKKMNILFKHYCSFGDKGNITNLKSAKWHKMLTEAGIEGSQDSKKSLDILFSKQTKNKPCMVFDLFIDSLPSIAEIKYPKLEKNAAITDMIQKNFIPLYEKISGGTGDKTFDIKPNDLANEMLKSDIPIMFDLYRIYWDCEKKTSDDKAVIKDNSLKGAFNFLADCEICPGFLNKTLAHQIWETACSTKEAYCKPFVEQKYFLGVVFTFSKFLDFILKLAYYGTGEEANFSKQYHPPDLLMKLLIRIESSKGLQNVEKSTHRTHTENTTVIPPKIFIDKLNALKEQAGVTKKEAKEKNPLS